MALPRDAARTWPLGGNVGGGAAGGNGSRDPDGNELSVRWWHYAEAGPSPYPRALSIEEGAVSGQVRVRVPNDAAGTELHLILEVTDRHPEVPLTAYRRVVIRVSPVSGNL